jgi:hypothetical protein
VEGQLSKSNFNFLVVLSEEGIRTVDRARPFYRKWLNRKIDLPLFLTESYIKASLDSYPVEFLNMKNSYRVVQGKDVLTELKFSKPDVRLQCEREVKGYLLKLRQGFIQTSGSKKQVKSLIIESLVAFGSLFRAMLFLQDKEIPQQNNAIFQAACDCFGFDGQLFSELAAVSVKGEKRSASELDDLMRKYITEVKKMSEIIDKMNVK